MSTGFLFRRLFVSLLSLGLLLGTGCRTLKKAALGSVADALASGGTGFASDEDPELVREAAPFSLKMMETVLEQAPRHAGLLEATARGFTQYAYAFVLQQAEELEARDYAGAEAGRVRAKKLLLRARDYALRGLEVRRPGFGALFDQEAKGAVALCKQEDVGLLYWAAASWAAALSLGKDDPALLADMPRIEALIDRALVLEETFDGGALHSFLISYEMSRQGLSGDPAERSKAHFTRALELSSGAQVAPYEAYAEAVCLERQDAQGFEAYLQQALAVDPRLRPEWQVANLVLQRRARWLLSRKEDLFLK